ncbi:unnamed protein product [Ectocarpus sp. 4 AP-2014]
MLRRSSWNGCGSMQRFASLCKGAGLIEQYRGINAAVQSRGMFRVWGNQALSGARHRAHAPHSRAPFAFVVSVRRKNAAQEFVGGHGTFDLVLRPALLRKFFKEQCKK